jgi:hypothetical protein
MLEDTAGSGLNAAFGAILGNPVQPAPAGDPDADSDIPETSIERDRPDPEVERAAHVKHWNDRILIAREYWNKKAFKRMRDDMNIASGRQWPLDPTQMAGKDQLADEVGERYVANIIHRHIQQRTATIYGKDPKLVARRKERILNTVWDGSMTSLAQAMQAAQPAVDPVTGMMRPGDPTAMMVVMDAIQTFETNKQMDKIARTLELLAAHQIAEQTIPFKTQMKSTVRRALTTGVAFVKLGYQRVMDLRPEAERAECARREICGGAAIVNVDHLADERVT